jgi:PAS domain S-box-containing protein
MRSQNNPLLQNIADSPASTEARFRALVQYSSDVITVLAADGTVLYNTPAVTSVLGYDPDELLGRRTFDFVHPDDIEVVLARFAEALMQPGVAVPVTFRFRHRAGHWVPLDAIGSNRLDDPNVRGIVVNSRDTTERQRVEDSLRKSQQLYQLPMDQVPVGILFTDAVGQVTNANPAVIAMFDWPSAEHARQFNVLTLEVLQRAAVSRAYRSVLANRRIERADISYLSAARRRSDLRLVIAPLFDQPGSLLGTVTIAEDVTDRARANREKAALLEIARDISGTLDPTAILDRVHRRAAELLPCDLVVTWIVDPRGRHGLLQHGVPAAMAADIEAITAQADHPLMQAVRSGQTVVFDDIADQSWLPPNRWHALGIEALVIVPLIVGGTTTGALAAMRGANLGAFTGDEVQLFEGIARQVALMLGAADVHRAEQVEAEISAALMRVGRELISALNNPDLLNRLCEVTARVLQCDWSQTVLLDPQQHIYRVAANFGGSPADSSQLRALRVPESVGDSIVARLRNDDITRFDARRDLAVAAVNAEFNVTASVYMALRRGSDIIGILTASYRNGENTFTPAQEIVSETLNRQQLACWRWRTRAWSRSSSTPTASSPSSSRRCRTSCARRSTSSSATTACWLDGTFGEMRHDQHDAIARADRNARGLLELISATLDMSRLESGCLPLDLREFSLVELLEELEVEARELQRKPEVRFDWDTAPSLPPLHSDRAKIKMVIKTLVGNAVKFTDAGIIAVRAQPASAGVEVRVQDTGCGIAPEDLPVIFEPFRQAAGSQRGGVGLGLFIVRRLLSELGGSVDVDSAPGRGSTFHVWIPLRAVALRPQEMTGERVGAVHLLPYRARRGTLSSRL